MDRAAEVDALLENAAWVRALARQMLADGHGAEDVAQETWLAAMKSDQPPRGPWLARVVRNLVLQRRRSEGARASRERRVAKPEALPSAADTVARAELHSELVAAVLALDEPFRSTVLWRYFDDLSDEQIAQRSKVELATVRSRLKRARERLREKLGGKRGRDAESNLVLLLGLDRPGAPLVPVVSSSTAGTLGVFAMGLKVALVVAATCVLGAAWWWTSGDGAAAQPSVAKAQHETPAAGPAEAARTDESADVARESVAATPPNGAPTNGALAPEMLHGVVLSEDGRVPLAGARVTHRRGSEEATFDETPEQAATRSSGAVTTDELGRFAVPPPESVEVGLWFEGPGHFPLKLSVADLPHDTQAPLEVVLAPLGQLEVALVDENGAGVADIPLRYSIDVNRGSQDHRWRHRTDNRAGVTDANGSVRIDDLPCGMPISLRRGETYFLDDEYLGRALIDPHERSARFEIRFETTATISGRVLHADGSPAASTKITWQTFPLGYREPHSILADTDGRFAMTGRKPGGGELRIEVAGVEPRVLALDAGQAVDLGDIELPTMVLLGGRIVSRFGPVEEWLGVHLFRRGREIGVVRVRDGQFLTEITAGELELFVVRGQPFQAGNLQGVEILARRSLATPANDLEIALDTSAGAIDFDLSGAELAQGTHATCLVYSINAAGKLRYLASLQSQVDGAGKLRASPVPPGKVRVNVVIQGAGSALSAPIEVKASQVSEGGALVFAKATVLVRVTDSKRAPLAKASVELRASEGPVEEWTGEDGRARIEGVEPGLYRVAVKHGELGAVREESVALAGGEVTELAYQLGGFATIEGRVRNASGPLAGLSIDLQPSRSNDLYNAVTDAEGRFRLDHLPTGRLRLWSTPHFVQVLDLEPGATEQLDLVVESPRELRFRREGEPVRDLFSVYAIAFEREALATRRWSMGEEKGDAVEIEVPIGTTLFMVACGATGAQGSYLALADPRSGEVELAGGRVAIDTPGAWNGPVPEAELVSIDGFEVMSPWASPIGLVVEVDGEGHAFVACVPPKAVVKIEGAAADGTPFDVTVDTRTTTRVSWR